MVICTFIHMNDTNDQTLSSTTLNIPHFLLVFVVNFEHDFENGSTILFFQGIVLTLAMGFP
uniref:Uncharacterized protein n=1 Tax=Lepeophtheirus salmonis TaxID=72036 RepID=A0A0K2U3R2_LEPSM